MLCKDFYEYLEILYIILYNYLLDCSDEGSCSKDSDNPSERDRNTLLQRCVDIYLFNIILSRL